MPKLLVYIPTAVACYNFFLLVWIWTFIGEGDTMRSFRLEDNFVMETPSPFSVHPGRR